MIRWQPLVFLIVIAVVFLAGCSSDSEPEMIGECMQDSDCPPESGACMLSTCYNNECFPKMELGCCGNNRCEAGETQCTCPEDCKPACTGPASITDSRGNPLTLQYFIRTCEGTVCKVTYDAQSVDKREAYYSVNQQPLVFGLTVGYVQPFDIAKSKVRIELQLKDYNAQSIRPPVVLKEIRLMESSQLLGRKTAIGYNFSQIGDSYSVDIPLIYTLDVPEKDTLVNVVVDYQYMTLKMIPVLDEDGNTVTNEYGETQMEYVDDKQIITSMNQNLEYRLTLIDPSMV